MTQFLFDLCEICLHCQWYFIIMMAFINFPVKLLCINGFELRFVIRIPFYLWFVFHPKCMFHVQEEKARFSLWILNMCL